MKNRFRKLVSLVSAVVMLLAVLPICAASVTAATAVVDVNFDDGSQYFSSSSTVAIVNDGGSNVLHWSATKDWSNIYKGITVAANTEYLVTFRMKSNLTNQISVKFVLNDWSTVDAHVKVTPTAEWAEYSVMLTSKETTSVLFMFQTNVYASSGQQIYLDDIVLMEKSTETEGNNVINNGDFETGNSTGWSTHQSTTISAEAAYEGSYGAKLVGGGGWGGMLNCTFYVEEGKTYEISFWYKTIANGVNLQIYSPSVQSDKTKYYTSGWLNKTAWTKMTYTITATIDDQITINFCGSGNGNAETVYVDNVTALKMKEPSFDGYLYDGDFEYTEWSDSWINVNGSCTVSIVEGHDSSQALSVKAGKWQQVRQKFSVKANTDYNITLWAKDTSDITMIFKTGSTDANYLQTSISAGSTWTKISYNFNSGDNTSLYLGFMGNDSGNGTAILDDITIVELKDPSFDGWLYNGDFEAGSLTKWSPAQSTQISKNAAHTGNFGAQLMGNGSYGGLLDQTFNTVVGVSYKVTIWVKGVSAGCNFTFKDSSGNKLGDDASFYASADNSADWKQWTAEFVATTSTTLLNICGGGTGIAENVYVDDIVVTALMADPVSGGQTSVSEDVSGLQFKFDVAATGVTAENNEYDAGSGKVTPYKDCATTYSLVGMGAVVTNLASVGGSIDKMVLESVDGSNKVISIPVVYLYEYDQTSVSFAVRITNIPDTKYDTFVYARAYFIFEDGRGNQITIYDDQVMKQTYNGANA